MSDRSLTTIYAHPADVLEPVAAFLKAVEYLRLDPEARDIEADLLEYAQQLLQLHTEEGKRAYWTAETEPHVNQANEVQYA
ncbi:hypothetical protein [Xenorhabdus griffiniae]|uniref:Phage tail protein n=1 Tax=Xenorhabdus griffiniae TaxID=351672 RepID=A0ABY9XKJ6_9GAMM|nr:hypothetical protein [Xenorhabdus griffiniae]MBD1228581.1 hypothetical protein [Xenorhabdus griffiniae]MBE8588682.1 hypothetical protein [Xenorhabdus griffiniae]WMV73460.1 hypothetical protein QL128_05390 [Xenorhabdus griffiniae]WNH03139.1 hypothetical protein QL112_005395 [Xenorhabdus griffiniae]